MIPKPDTQSPFFDPSAPSSRPVDGRSGLRLIEFLGLSDEEGAFVELKLTLSASLKKYRTSQGLSQSELAKRLRSSQSRVAKMEASDPAVSVDLLIRALLAAGAKKKDIAKAIARSEREYAAQKQTDEEAARGVGMKEKAEEFVAAGGEIYQ